MKFVTEEKHQLVARYHNGESATNICIETGVARSTFYTWLKPYKATHTDTGYRVSAAEFIKMKQHLEKLEQKIEVLQK
ncbi:helix-turn-helix resolvase-like protein [Desulfitobacterium sp. LBE]|uniref:helix-turn-helix domain-containing protein n=1 Tax=Desulfitobacterium sp. LBE TaxID=884086 RepID=UPI00119921FE|nr:helix-turn-helix domain-containing protein [Desulfitobacterium sp. LBE]TWH59439.1 helix-turn-helix resolvase-like protein [Desulfitobacterium sp. LBE]